MGQLPCPCLLKDKKQYGKRVSFFMACIPYLTHQWDKNWVNKGKTSKRHAEGKHQCLRIGIMHQLYFKPPGYGVVGCLGVITDRSPLVIGCQLVAGHLFLLRIRYSHSSARESQEFLCPQSLECFKDLFWPSFVLPGVWPPCLLHSSTKLHKFIKLPQIWITLAGS